MATKPEPKAILVLVDSLTDGDVMYNKGAVVLEPSDALLACAESKRTDGDGNLLCRKMSKAEALKAAKRADAGDENVFFAAEEEDEVSDVDTEEE